VPVDLYTTAVVAAVVAPLDKATVVQVMDMVLAVVAEELMPVLLVMLAVPVS
jgi:hypothetical protein